MEKSKLTLRGEIMIHYAAMISAHCSETFCPYCPFSNYNKVINRDNCLLMAKRPAEWEGILEKIREEAKE